MAQFRVPYGRSSLSASLPDSLQTDIVNLTPFPAAADPVGVVRAALDNILGDVDWEVFAGAQTAAIAINDNTRPVPHHYLLPPLVQKLEDLGIPSGAIRFIIASGAHSPMKPNEYVSVVPPDILANYSVDCHNTDEVSKLIDLGTTSRGTPVLINRDYFHADLRIVVGNIEPHQFQGFSGGVKSAAIGLAGRDTINSNHALMADPAARLGHYDHNPARQDVEEIGRIIGQQVALNTILNDKKEIVQVLAGEPKDVMNAGIPLAKEICQVQVPCTYDIVIASPGGYPKDLNIYQAQKGLAHASLVARTGGTVILVAACEEGGGSHAYERWVQGFDSHEAVLAGFAREGFRVGPHKAYQIAQDATRVNVRLVSEMDPEFVRRLLLQPAASLQEAVDASLHLHSSQSRICIMPNANVTIPLVVENE